MRVECGGGSRRVGLVASPFINRGGIQGSMCLPRDEVAFGLVGLIEMKRIKKSSDLNINLRRQAGLSRDLKNRLLSYSLGGRLKAQKDFVHTMCTPPKKY